MTTPNKATVATYIHLETDLAPVIYEIQGKVDGGTITAVVAGNKPHVHSESLTLSEDEVVFSCISGGDSTGVTLTTAQFYDLIALIEVHEAHFGPTHFAKLFKEVKP